MTEYDIVGYINPEDISLDEDYQFIKQEDIIKKQKVEELEAVIDKKYLD